MNEATEHAPGGAPRRSVPQRIALVIFSVGLVTFLLSGILLVLLQAVGLALGDAALTVGTIPGLQTVMTVGACVTGLLAFVMSYLFGWKASDD